MKKKQSTPEFETIDFECLVGQKAKLYLHAPNVNQFQLGSILFEVVEDENDGYRSAMQEVRILDRKKLTAKSRLLAEVTIQDSTAPDDDGWILVDNGGHTWLEFGTNRADDYYPSFIFNWAPKIPKKPGRSF